MKRLITSVGSTLLLAALVIGSPTALLAWGRLDGLARLSPSALMGPDDGTIVLGLVTVTGWAAWFVFTLSVVIEAVALATHSRVHVTLPGLSLVQGLAAGLLWQVSPSSHRRHAAVVPHSRTPLSQRSASLSRREATRCCRKTSRGDRRRVGVSVRRCGDPRIGRWSSRITTPHERRGLPER